MLKLIDERLLPSDDKTQPLMLDITDRGELRQSYMPGFLHGGLFIPMPKPLPPGSKVLLVIRLPGEQTDARRTIHGKVGYRSPSASGGQHPVGVGVAFGDDEACLTLKRDIERMIATVSRDVRSFSF